MKFKIQLLLGFLRKARLKHVEHILIGAGLGRSGTTNLAMNLHNQGWSVSHEAGNNGALDFTAKLQDKFTIRTWPRDRRAKWAKQFLNDMILAKPSASTIVGDVSHVHSQSMSDFLEADKRVAVVFLYRSRLNEWVESVKNHQTKPGFVETHLMQSRGVTAEKFPDRGQRLKEYAKRCLTEVLSLIHI